MTHQEYEIIIGSALCFIMGMLVGILIVDLCKSNYRKGQIDALDGKIKYKKTNTETWKKIK